MSSFWDVERLALLFQLCFHACLVYLCSSNRFGWSADTCIRQKNMHTLAITSTDNDKNDAGIHFNCSFEIDAISNEVQRAKCLVNFITDGAMDDVSMVTEGDPSNVRLTSLSGG